MHQKIEDLLNERFVNDNDSYDTYDKNDIYVGEALAQLFKENGFEEDDFSIECDILFSNPAIDIGYLSIAFVNWNGHPYLNHIVYSIERV